MERKTRFIKETSIKLMAASVVNVAINKETYWDSQKAAEQCVDDAEYLWIELKKRGYCKED